MAKKVSKPSFVRKKFCRLCKNEVKDVDYKDVDFLQRFITEKGKIISTRVSRNCAKHQRKIAQAIKRARIMALLPFVGE